MENVSSQMPVWATEFWVGVGLSFFIVIVYGVTLYYFRNKAAVYKNLKKWANIVVALYAWVALLYDKIHQGAQEAQISIDTSLLFYAAIVFAVITIIHAMVEPTE